MSISAPYGLCASVIVPLDADGAPDTSKTNIVSCGLVDVSMAEVLTDAVTVKDASGIAGRECLSLELDGVPRWVDVTITTCSVFDPRMDNFFGQSDLMVNSSNHIIGSKAQSPASQICLCDWCNNDGGSTGRAALILWSLNLCPSATSLTELHPDGGSMITVLPGVQFRHTTNPLVKLSSTVQGKQYTGRTFSNPDFGQGPGSILPAIESPYDRHWYRFSSTVCPPSGCDCGACGGTPITFP